jgi:hypothetical protein
VFALILVFIQLFISESTNLIEMNIYVCYYLMAIYKPRVIVRPEILVNVAFFFLLLVLSRQCKVGGTNSTREESIRTTWLQSRCSKILVFLYCFACSFHVNSMKTSLPYKHTRYEHKLYHIQITGRNYEDDYEFFISESTRFWSSCIVLPVHFMLIVWNILNIWILHPFFISIIDQLVGWLAGLWCLTKILLINIATIMWGVCVV